MSKTLEEESQFNWTLKTARIALIASLAFLGLLVTATAAMTALTAIDALETGRWAPLASSVAIFLASLIAVAWVLVVYGIIQATIANAIAVRDSSGLLERIETLLQHQDEALRKLIELGSISEEAKSLIYRETEIDALRETIQDDIIRQDFAPAAHLIETMRTKFGYEDEAAQLSGELQVAQQATVDERIEYALRRIQQIMDAHDWAKALRGAQKLQSLFPDNPKVADLPQRVEVERTKRKRQLLSDYDEAVRKNDVDAGIDLLKELDRHLTPQEAAALEESARGVFKAKLHNLGVQFAICVSDERWAEAVATGEEIMRSFPNSRMSHEVRQKMAQLRTHAAETPVNW